MSVKRIRQRPTRLLSVVAGLAVVGLALAGCSTGGSGGGSSSGKGVAPGATEAEYQAAFKNVKPVTLKFQATGAEGSEANVGIEAYAKAITEWSGGKIKFEWGYSNGFVPDATQWAAGLGDGRIDMGLFLPYYTPQDFPKLSDLSSMTFLDGNAPTSTLVSAAWTTQAAYEDTYVKEAEAGGIHILAAGPSVSIAGIFCSKPLTSLADFKGEQISASGGGRVAELTALGFSTQSIAFTELYEALERKVLTCGSTVPTALESVGASALVPYAVADPKVALSGFPNYIAINDDQWNALPLVGRQLFTDKLDVFFESEPGAQGDRVKIWLQKAVAAGGGIKGLSPDAEKALEKANDKLLDALQTKGTDVTSLKKVFTKWQTEINTKLYPKANDDSLERFLLEDGYKNLDYTAYTKAIFDDILSKSRPK